VANIRGVEHPFIFEAISESSCNKEFKLVT
jgi:hypothetical protein